MLTPLRTIVLDGLRFLRGRSNRSVVISLSALLGIAIGASTVVVGLVDSLLLRPLPFPGASRLVDIGLATSAERSEGALGRIPSVAQYQAWRSARVFEGAGAFESTFPTEIGNGTARRVIAVATSASMIGLLGGRPMLGRAFIDDDDLPGRPGVAILSARAWRNDYGGEASVLGRAITLSGRSYEIVGVMPPSFRIPNSVPETQRDDGEIWISLGSYLDLAHSRTVHGSALRSPGVDVVGRLWPNETVGTLEASLVRVTRDLGSGSELDDSTLIPVATPMRDRIVGEARGPVFIVAGAVWFFLVVICANAAGILLARAVTRTPELAVRIALGASKRRIAAQLAAESLSLSAIGGAIGVMLGGLALPMVVRLYGPELPDVGPIRTTGALVVFSMLASAFAGLAVTMGPLMHLWSLDTSKPNGSQALRRDAWRNRLLSPLVVAEVSLTLMLVATAAIFVDSLINLRYRSRGYDARHIIAAPVLFSPPYAVKAHQDAFIRDALDRLEGTPGVTSAAVSSGAPVIGGPSMPVRSGVGRGATATMSVWAMSPRFLQMLRVPVLRGRLPSVAKEPSGVVLDMAAAHVLFGNDEPLGKSIVIGTDSAGSTVVAVVGNIDDYDAGGWTGAATHNVAPHVYVALATSAESFGRLTFIVRSRSRSTAVLGAVQRVIAGIDHDLPIDPPTTIQQLIDFATSRARFLCLIVSFFAVLGLMTALGGIYALVAYTAARRTHEMGIRLALGASPGQVVRLITGDGFRLTLVGIALGVPLAIGASRLVRGYVVDVSLANPRADVSIVILLLAAGTLASYVASRRVARADPLDALRET